MLTQDSTLRRCAVVTTTYDNLLEKAFLETGQGDGAVPDFHVLSYQTEDVWLGRFLHVRYRNGSRSEPVVIEKPNEYMGLAGDTFPLIVKMPGAVEGDNFTYAISEDSFFAFAGRSLPRLLPREVIAKLQNSCHLYLGYKISDWNLRALLYSIWENERPRLDAWALLSPTSQDDLPPWWAGGLPDETRAEKSYWRTSDVEVIEAPLDVFVRRLRQLAEPGV